MEQKDAPLVLGDGRTDVEALTQALAAPFERTAVKIKPGVVSGNRALALPYVDLPPVWWGWCAPGFVESVVWNPLAVVVVWWVLSLWSCGQPVGLSKGCGQLAVHSPACPQVYVRVARWFTSYSVGVSMSRALWRLVVLWNSSM